MPIPEAPTRSAPDFTREVIAILGIPLDMTTRMQARHKLEMTRLTGGRCFLSTPNLNFAVQGLKNPAFRDSVCRSNLSVADGMPLVWISRWLGVPLAQRISGSGLFDSLRETLYRPWHVFFFGGPQGVGQDASLKLGQAGSGMVPCGHIYPGFVSIDELCRPDLLQVINQAKPDLLVVSLGSEKGQQWIMKNLAHLHVPVVSHLGAVVNFAAGSVARAPMGMQRAGLEWLWRIKEEPRLLGRYLGDGLALLGVSLSRVLPLALHGAWMRRHISRHEEQVLRVIRSASRLQHLQLQGIASACTLQPLRQALTEAWPLQGSIRLDLSGLQWFDAAFVGLLLLLECALRDRGDSLQLVGLSRRHQLLLHWHCADHLHRDSP